MVTWRCTRHCVGNCLYCSYSPPVKPEDAEVNTKLAYKIVDEVYDFGSPWFGISGGEPLVREDIFDVIEYAKRMGFEVSLITVDSLSTRTALTASSRTRCTRRSA